VAKAARADGLAREIVAVGRRRESLEPALQDGTVDHITLDVAEGVAGADLCVLCTPVATLTELLPVVWRAASDDVVSPVTYARPVPSTAIAVALSPSPAFVAEPPM